MQYWSYDQENRWSLIEYWSLWSRKYMDGGWFWCYQNWVGPILYGAKKIDYFEIM